MNFTKSLFAVSTLLISSTFVFAQGTPSKYTEADLVWQDNFDKKVNTKDWNYEIHEPGWVNAELQSYGKSNKNTYIKDGKLVIQAIKTEKKDGTIEYTSGRINTQGKHAFTYGRFEARLKVPTGKGFLPAFWMMPDDESLYGQWPKCGEIDIMEVMGQETNKLYGTIHYGSPHAQTQGIKVVDEKENFADNYHTFAVEWEPGEIRWYCDGENYKTAKDWFTKKVGFPELTYPAPFDQPFYIIFNVAVGGSWVGYPDDTVNFDPNSDDAKMYVDYVKVYQKKSYDENVEKPAKEAAVAKTDLSGNMISSDKAMWEFKEAGGGKGAVEGDGKSHKITSTSAGSLEYSVQYVQPKVPLNQGYVYRYSFDAYADAERTMITGISAPDFNYQRRFSDTKVKLSTSKQHYSFEFEMEAEDDANCRLEYNLGAQDSTATVYISNIRLEKIGEIKIENDKVLPDGNYIWNGQFQEGKNRLGNWEIKNNAKAEISVTKDRERRLMVVSPKKAKAEDVSIKQSGLELKGGKAYTIKFDIFATKSANLVAKFAGREEKVKLFAKQLPKANATPAKGAKPFMPDHFEWLYKPETDTTIDFELLLGTDGGTVYVDNVFVKENCVVTNGGFEKGMKGWEAYVNPAAGAECEIIEENGNKQAKMTVEKTGNLDWMIQLKQEGCLLEKGKSYRITLKAKSDLKRMIMLALQGNESKNWFPYSNTLKFEVDNEWKDYTWEFTMGRETDENVIFTISMGNVTASISKQHHIYFDSIVVEEFEKEQKK